MNKTIYLLIAFALFVTTGCTLGKADTKQSNVKYESYHNHRYDYTVDYPDFLIPQGEATNEDGQMFLSQDEKSQLLVYCGYRFDFNREGDYMSIDKAYEEDIALKEDMLKKEFKDNHYTIDYRVNDMLHTDYVLVKDDMYYTISFQYPENDETRMDQIVQNVIKSLKLEVLDFDATAQDGNVSAGGAVDMFPAFIEGFLNDCYWDKNFNTLLRSNDKTLATYIDPKMDVRRYHAPGTVTKLATRAEDFGFTEYDDFETKPTHDGDVILEYINDDSSPMDLIYTNSNVVYYVEMQEVPELLVDMETFETASVRIAYPDAEIMAVYLPDSYLNPRGFYFFNTPDGWKLAFVDDSFGGA